MFEIPYRKIIKLALVTSPLLGIFGAAPIFVFGRGELTRISSGFLALTLLVIAFWMVNIVLLRVWDKMLWEKKQWLRYVCSIPICIAILYLVTQLLPGEGGVSMHNVRLRDLPGNFPNPPPLGSHRMFLMPALQSQSINALIIVFIEIILLRERKLFIESENAQLKIANLEARHGLLKQQLHPHFLFNSLSILGALIRRSPTDAENYLERLSSLLRFSTENDSKTLVKLEDEVELCRNYLEMQQVRFGKSLSFSVDIPKEMTQNGRVPVYSIQLLVENAIKHNILTTEQPLNIAIVADPTNYKITVINNLRKKNGMGTSSGLGLSNLSERYHLLGQEPLEVTDNGNNYFVTLKVLANESSNH
ncbi:MAG: histidine kinase [Chitinophagaceae bacterium]